MKKLIITVLGGGPGRTWTASDVWGLISALEHGLQDGYLNDNRVWAEQMVLTLGELRRALHEVDEVV